MKRLIVTVCASAALAASAAPSAYAQQTHRFVPDKFYNTYSAAHPPALHIKSGDRVITKTIDAAGVDWNGKTVAQGPNPETGPFFIDGAEPGDMLVVTFDKIETNRAMAYSGSLLAPYAATPQAINARVDREAKRLTWTIDKAKGVARLDDAAVQPGGIELPLRPMLGCVGVAPRGKEAIATSTPGAWGGNMDYAWLNAGVKVMLPVNEPGALLFMGDGHARQGDGEVGGTAIECPMRTEAIVELAQDRPLATIHAETPDSRITFGFNEDLNLAMGDALDAMVTWMTSLYEVDKPTALALASTVVDLRVTQVANQVWGVHAVLPNGVLA
jgi:acetamidase/formamidase